MSTMLTHSLAMLSSPPQNPTATELDNALELLHFAFREITLEPDKLLARRGLGRVHHRVLFMCRRNAGLSIGELVQILGVSKQALHRPVGDLSRLRLLSVTPDRTDRRTRRLALTAAGARLEERLTGMQRDAVAAAFACVGREGAAAWAAVMSMLGNGKSAAGLRLALLEPPAEAAAKTAGKPSSTKRPRRSP